MAGPPEDVPASELFLALQQPRPSEVVKFPRKTLDGRAVGTVRILVLGMVEHDRARLAALEKVRKQHKLGIEETQSGMGKAILEDAAAREILAIACVGETPVAGSEDSHAPRYPRIFPDAESLNKTLSADEVAVLWNCYRLVQTKWGPFEKSIGPGELTQWIRRLVEGGAEFPLQFLSSVPLEDLASSLARRAYLLSVILGYLRPSLPPTLASRLESYCMDISSSGSLASSGPTDGSGISPSLKVADVEITIEDAQSMALLSKETEALALEAFNAIEDAKDY